MASRQESQSKHRKETRTNRKRSNDHQDESHDPGFKEVRGNRRYPRRERESDCNVQSAVQEPDKTGLGDSCHCYSMPRTVLTAETSALMRKGLVT